MAKIRVHELAKKLGLTTKEVVQQLKSLGFEVRSNLSSVKEDEATKALKSKAGAKKPPAGKAASAATATDKTPARTAPRKKAAQPAPAAASRPSPSKASPGSTAGGTAAAARPAAPKPVPQAPPAPRAAPKPAPRSRPTEKPAPPKAAEEPAIPSGPPKPISVSEGVTVRELAEKMDIKANDILKKLLLGGVMTNVNTPLDPEAAKKVALEFGYEATVVSFEEDEVLEEQATRKGSRPEPRFPVVTVMGHVDHGKTSLLDAVRETHVVDREHGGITQHIGAHQVHVKNRGITFLDTPGHEAFTLMRARGARVTDIVVLVVAADDGVMPQTLEAIDHARAADVPLIVAINKIDKPDANPDNVKKQLADRNLLVEDWGGDVVSVNISAKQKQGLDDLLDMILLVADMQDLKSDPGIPASGTVLEARLDRNRGPVATVLIQDGTLKVSDPFIAGAVNGKVRAMFNEAGDKVEKVGPSTPVEVLGLQGVPEAGDPFKVIAEEWKARQIGAFRQAKLREETLQQSTRMTLSHLFEKIQEGSVKELSLIVKADVQGSIEALKKILQDISSEKVKIRIARASAGAITESDVLLATTTNSIVIGFNVRPERGAAELAEKEKVDVRLHTVVYNIANEIKAAMVGMLDPTFKEVFLGRAEVRETFKVPKFGIIAGCMVVDGKMVRNADVRLLRDNVVVHSGKASSLRRFKDDVGEVKSGFECGIGIERFNDIKPGDVIEAYKVEKIVSTELYA